MLYVPPRYQPACPGERGVDFVSVSPHPCRQVMTPRPRLTRTASECFRRYSLTYHLPDLRRVATKVRRCESTIRRCESSCTGDVARETVD